MNYPDLYCYMNKLKIQQNNLEKTAEDILKTLEGQYDGTIQELYNGLQKTRAQEFNPIQRDISDNYRCLKYIKLNTIEKNLHNIDIKQLKQEMMTLEKRHEMLKEQVNNEINNLCKLENNLTMDVVNIDMKISDSFKSEPDLNKKSTQLIHASNSQHLCEEVKEFLKYLDENGGHSGGWTHDDHSIFLKIFARIKNNNQLIKSLQNLFAEMSREDIIKHMDWYTTYLELRNKHKIAIEKWRENKTKKEEKKVEKPPDEMKSKSEINLEYNRYIKEKVIKWRAEKQQKIEEIKSVQKTKASEKQRVKSQETKEQVRKWKSTKEAKEKAEQLAKEILYLREKERRMLQANKLIRDFQSQDNILISKRLNQLKINVEPPKYPDMDKKTKFMRNPERLHRPTKQWLAKSAPEECIRTMFEKHLPLKNIPKL